jgi:hypothetical protein
MDTMEDMATTMEGMEVGIIKYHYFPVVGPAAALPRQASRNRSPFCPSPAINATFSGLEMSERTPDNLVRLAADSYAPFRKQGTRCQTDTTDKCTMCRSVTSFSLQIGNRLFSRQHTETSASHCPSPGFPCPGFSSLPRPDAKVHDTLRMDSRGIQERNPEFFFIE